MMRFLAGFLLVAVSAGPAAARGGSVIAAGGQWAAIVRGQRCDAESRIGAHAGAGSDGIVGFAFGAGGRPWGQFHVRLTRVPRSGSSVIATIAGQSHLLVARGRDAWGRDARQDEALLQGVRSADSIRIEARDSGGRRFADRYSLTFAPTAIDAAAARCSMLGGSQR